MNIVAMYGRLTKDVDLRYTQSGKAVGSFTLAVPRNFKNAQGEIESDFIRCVIWDKPAETFANFVRKGHRVNVSGRLQTRSYEDRDGKTVYVTELVVENFTFVESRKEADRSDFNQPNTNTPGSGQNAPGGRNGDNTGYNSFGTEVEISDDDLPF